MSLNPKVLFVDDEPHLLAALSRNLRNDFKIVTACGGEEGLASLKNLGPFVAVVADMQMPGMDGIEFLKQVKEFDCSSVRIMLTGNADQATRLKANEEAQIDAFLNKPCTPEFLRDSILELLNRKAA